VTIKQIKARSVIRIEARNHNEKRYFYLKRHNSEFVVFRRLLALLLPKWIVSQGRREFENIYDFRKHNLATVVPVAAGEKFVRLFWAESFLITEDFSPSISMEDLLRDQPEFLMGIEGAPRKRILLNDIALFARRMHQEGFNHRDFNATHILLQYDNGSDVPKIALFDLQRVDRRKFLRFRWMIKSLARLNYTLPDEIFDAEDRVYLFLSYKGNNKLHVWDRLQWFWIKRKTTRIKRHTEKMMARREERKRRGLIER
jgi:heptose I phosphotransferase